MMKKRDDGMQDQEPDPMDHYDEYCAWLMQTAHRRDYRIGNGDDLIRALERGDGWDEFLGKMKR